MTYLVSLGMEGARQLCGAGLDLLLGDGVRLTYDVYAIFVMREGWGRVKF